jgi:uncharacterized membrane protein
VTLAAVGDDSYDLVLLLHILAAIIGFGAVFLNAIYGAQVRAKRGAEGLAILQANFLVSKIATYFIYAVFILGFLLVLMSDDVWGFGDTWVWLAMLLYVVGVGLSHGIQQPSVRRMIDLMEDMEAAGPPAAGSGGPPPQAAEMQELGKRLGVTGAALNILMVLVLYLMVFKPGM